MPTATSSCCELFCLLDSDKKMKAVKRHRNRCSRALLNTRRGVKTTVTDHGAGPLQYLSRANRTPVEAIETARVDSGWGPPAEATQKYFEVSHRVSVDNFFSDRRKILSAYKGACETAPREGSPK